MNVGLRLTSALPRPRNTEHETRVCRGEKLLTHEGHPLEAIGLAILNRTVHDERCSNQRDDGQLDPSNVDGK